ncbi:33264_t:CDS:1, partial [Gigaspora margarita]
MSEVPQIIHRPPFPPKSLNFPEIINESLRKYRTGKSSKTPNAYLLYRKEYTATFKNSNLGHISTLSSEAWNSEPHEVKLAYRQYADKINEIVKREIPYCFVANKAERNSDTSDDDNETNQSNQSNSETSDDNRMSQFNQMTEINQINLSN